MTELELRNSQTRIPASVSKPQKADTKWMRKWWFLLLAALLFVEMVLPLLIWKVGLPDSIDFIREPMAMLFIGFTVIYMLVTDRFPKGLLIILGISLVWGVLALLSGQSIGATLWGWFRFFKYPLLLFFAYSIPDWPKDFSRWFIKFAVVLLAFQVGVQLIQFALGEPVGDHLAGTFGLFGTTHYAYVLLFIVCIGMGVWLSTGDLKTLLFILVLGIIASTLSEIKLFLFGVPLTGFVALVVNMLRGGRIRQLFMYIIAIGLSLGLFIAAYNLIFVPQFDAYTPTSLDEYTDINVVLSYLLYDGGDNVAEYGYQFGKGYSLVFAWDRVYRDALKILFGSGLGSWTYSSALNVAGHAILVDPYNFPNMTHLASWILEFGFVGLLTFSAIMFWVVVKLFRHAKSEPDKYLAALEYGLLLFTVLWPVWLFYGQAWYFGGMMIMYWVSLGYVFQQIYRKPQAVTEANPAIPNRRTSPIPLDN